MRRRTVSLAALGVAVAFGVLVASAAALAPPAGTPDLSQMTIQPSDLAAGAKIGVDAYAKPPANFAAEYDRTFTVAATKAGVRMFGLDTQVLLANTPAVAVGFFTLERGIYRSKLGRRLLSKALESDTGKNGVKLTQVHFEKFRALALGSQAFVQAVLLKIKNVKAAADFVVLRDGSVVTTLTVVLVQPKRTLAVATELGKDFVTHITAVLAATGPTGPSGATGAS